MGYIKDLMTLSHGEAYCDELFHFGIKGMKWGVRRYQNTDGSYTAAGKKRYYGNDIVRNYRQNKLNRETKKFFTLDGGYKKLDKIMRAKGPTAYGRWYASDNTAQARREINRLHKHTSKLLNKYGKKYKIVYDVMTEQYYFQPKN